VSLANCYFAHDSSGFPVLLSFFDTQSAGASLENSSPSDGPVTPVTSESKLVFAANYLRFLHSPAQAAAVGLLGHVGFRSNREEHNAPVICTVEYTNSPRIVVDTQVMGLYRDYRTSIWRIATVA
jgi:hypothetical protein